MMRDTLTHSASESRTLWLFSSSGGDAGIALAIRGGQWWSRSRGGWERCISQSPSSASGGSQSCAVPTLWEAERQKVQETRRQGGTAFPGPRVSALKVPLMCIHKWMQGDTGGHRESPVPPDQSRALLASLGALQYRDHRWWITETGRIVTTQSPTPSLLPSCPRLICPDCGDWSRSRQSAGQGSTRRATLLWSSMRVARVPFFHPPALRAVPASPGMSSTTAPAPPPAVLVYRETVSGLSA